jgi:lysozyme family protein
MADFSLAIAKTILWEGGYSNSPHDAGGETYRGISRKNFPNWEGWAAIDLYKEEQGFPAGLDTDINIQGKVLRFYRKNFWDYDGLLDQDVAWKVFDLGVNVGKVHSIKILQKAVGTNQDGVYGPNTERLANSHPQGSLEPMIRTAAELYHKDIVQEYPEDAEFLRGWLRRDDS